MTTAYFGLHFDRCAPALADLDSSAHAAALRRGAPDLGRRLELLLRQSKIGANHLSAVGSKFSEFAGVVPQISSHHLSADADLLYAADFPGWMFAEHCALELENSLAEQLAGLSELRSHLQPPAPQAKAA